MDRHNWEVCIYDENCKIVQRWTIEDRTEHEAENEAMADLPADCFDWTLTSLK